jgi:hypothetical protein
MIIFNHSFILSLSQSQGFYTIHLLPVHLHSWRDPLHAGTFLARPYNLPYLGLAFRAVKLDFVGFDGRQPGGRVDEVAAALGAVSVLGVREENSPTVFAAIVLLFFVLHSM